MKFLTIISFTVCCTFLSCHQKTPLAKPDTVSCTAMGTASCKTQAPSRKALIKTNTDKSKKYK